jgi:hypothetical protein
MHQKVKNIRRDPRVALSLLGDKTNAQGMREYVVVYGNARVTEGGAVDLLHAWRQFTRAEGGISACFYAEHSGLRHPDRAGMLLRDRSVGSTSR